MSEDYSKFNHISTETVEDDLKETQEEKANYEAELDVLNRNPFVGNKEKVCTLTRKVAERNRLIDFLTGLLEHRNGEK